MDIDISRPRVNGSMLSSYQGRQVCALGMAKNVDDFQFHEHFVNPSSRMVDSSGMSLTLTTGEGKDVKVTMQEPLQEYVSGLTEIHGRVDSTGNSIICDHYVLFPEKASGVFDMQLYNQAVELMARLPDHYQIGVQQ